MKKFVDSIFDVKKPPTSNKLSLAKLLYIETRVSTVVVYCTLFSYSSVSTDPCPLPGHFPPCLNIAAESMSTSVDLQKSRFERPRSFAEGKSDF